MVVSFARHFREKNKNYSLGPILAFNRKTQPPLCRPGGTRPKSGVSSLDLLSFVLHHKMYVQVDLLSTMPAFDFRYQRGGRSAPSLF
ncbi:MAG: hypothetical protein DRJ65_17070 [Acidobacteria bacterium]|nr:MAG: hypothetical protein DRJ65_17070 [Acidobacteriota bacterium]